MKEKGNEPISGQIDEPMSKIGNRLFLFMGIVVMLIALWHICDGLKDYYQADRLYEKAKQEYVLEKDSNVIWENNLPITDSEKNEEMAAEEWQNRITVNIEKLQEENPDIVGWIYFEQEEISYPVLFSGDNQTYLRKAYTGESVTAGSIFMDGSNSFDFSDSHILIYGHNMRDLSMFGRLKYYKTQDGYYDTHQYFQIITKDNYYRYRIFAYKDVTATDGIYRVIQKNQKELADFAKSHIQKGSYLLTEEEIQNEDQVITLSTCTKEDERFVVSGVLVDVASRSTNDNP